MDTVLCGGCVHSVFRRIHSFEMSGNGEKCPFCSSESWDKTPEEKVERLMKRVEANVLVPFVHWPITITAELTGKGTGTLR